MLDRLPLLLYVWGTCLSTEFCRLSSLCSWQDEQWMHFAGVSGDLLHWSVGCVPAHLTQRKVWLQYFCVCPYLWHLLHCTISFLICGGSNFTIAFIRRLML